MIKTPEDVFKEIATAINSLILAELYARVSQIPMLSHYTSIDAFKSILQSRELWFSLIRNTNDTSEAVEGTKIVAGALDEYGPKIFQNYAAFKVREQFEARRQLLENDTYVLSLCEHGSDQRTDRLVMWQAYGHNGNGICMVFRKEAILGQTAQGLFPVHWCPLEYENAPALGERVRRRLQQLQRAICASPLAHTIPTPAFGLLISVVVVQLVLGHKNLAFEHEKEIRFVRSRLLQELTPPAGAGYRTITVDGKPSSKFVLPLRKYPEFSIDASLVTLLDHVIIGPSAQQDKISEEVRAVLDATGLGHVEVRRSVIPYRVTRA